MLYKYYTSHVHAYFMHTYLFFSFLFFVSVLCLCSLSLSHSLSLSWIDYTMAPKVRKSTLARNPLSSGSSSSAPIPSLHVQFRDEKAWKDFLENFQECGVHPKRHVILSDFSDTPLPTVIRTRGWESLLESPLRCPIMFIQEFYSNIHSIDTSVPRFATTFWDTRIVVTPDPISKVLHVLRVGHPNYPSFKRLPIVSKDELLSHFYETPSIWSGKKNTPCSGFAKGPRFLNMVIYSYFIVLLWLYHRASYLLSFVPSWGPLYRLSLSLHHICHRYVSGYGDLL